MSRKKLARGIGVCTMAIMIILAITIFPACNSSIPTLVIHDCTDQTVSSLKAQGEVTNTGGALLSRRGFVWLEGDSGDPALNLTSIPLVNPSFEEGDPPTGWSYFQPGESGEYSRSTEQVKSGNYSLEAISYDHKNSIITQVIPDWQQYKGKTVTLDVWVWADLRAQVAIRWGGFWDVSSSNLHPGDSQWHFLTITRTVLDTDTTLTIMLRSGDSNHLSSTSYFDGAILVKGDAVFEYSQFNTGVYNLTMGSLKSDTSYRVRAFGENEASIGYGNSVICKTL
jgi:hypothetical protein